MNVRTPPLLFLALTISLSLTSAPLYACPKVNGYSDFNCNQAVDITILGDSLGFGFGDSKNGNKGGYVLRSSRKFPNINFDNQSKSGQRTFELLGAVTRAFKGESQERELRNSLLNADVVVLDLGRNDRWLFGTPEATFRNLKRIASIIKSKVAAETGVAPLIVTAVLMLPNRGSQGPWVKALNEIILRSNSRSAPADLRFDLVSKRLLANDQIHPTSEGYNALGKTFIAYLQKNLPKKIAALRPDGDGDGIYDFFETLRYSTDPQNADTDGDGKGDGEEIFTLGTDALVAD